MDEVNFNSLGLSENVMKAINAMGFEEPSQIQALAIPVVLEGVDVIGQAQTGTGKTLAFGAPIISMLEGPARDKVKVLILVPTRELAIQVNDELVRLNKYTRYASIPVYGGQPIERQIRALRNGVDIVVGTPGRILDHIRRNTVDFSHVRYFVLDEADEMLNMGFIDDIREIMNSLGPERQTLLFSATMPDPIRKLASKHMRPGFRQIATIKSTLTVSLTSQFYFEIKQKDRFESLCRILDAEEPESALIFCRTKKGVDELVEALQSRGYSVEGMHGDMSQNQRINTLKKFKEGNLDYLAATDVAARGIDVENISHVINYELPEDPESYVHRIGRTGRANRTGIAYSLVTPREYIMLKQIEKITRSKIKRKDLPSVEDIYEVKYKSILSQVRSTLESEDYSKYVPLASELDDEYNLVDVAAALFKLLLDKEIGFNYDENENTPQGYGEEVRLFLSTGKMDRINKGSILRFILDNADIEKKKVGTIDLFDKFSFVNISEDAVTDVINQCSGKALNGRVVRIQVANSRK